MRVLITGIAGFVGRRLAPVLAERGHELAGTYIGERPEGLEAKLHRADLCEPASLVEVCHAFEPESVLHLAGLSHVGASFGQPERYRQVNVLGTEHLLGAVGAAPVVFASSAEVYGPVPEAEQPITERRTPAPRSPYGETKLAAERLVLDASGVVVRSFNIIGPGQAPTFALPTFARQLVEIGAGLRPPIVKVGNLESERDFIHLDDAAEGYAVALERGEPGAIYNLATGRAYSIREMLDRLILLSGQEVTVEQDPARLRVADTPKLAGDSSRLRALGWKPRWDVDDALRALLESVRATHAAATRPSS